MSAQPPRTLADRLADLRTRQATQHAVQRRAESNGAERLARWFGARVEVVDGAATVVVERSIPLDAGEADSLAELPGAAYFDTETTGLSTGAGTVPFLAGIGVVRGRALVVRQLLLPDYPHERGLLRHLCGELAAADRLVTYNGRSFDVPLLVSRLTVHGFFAEQAALPAIHDDLLPVARRLWRRPLGGARLAEVEAAVLGVRRSSDCPSAEVPLRYFGYLRNGSPEPLVAVLDHNLQDIVSLARLEARIVQLLNGAWHGAQLLDHRGLALELIGRGESEQAGEVLAHALTNAPRGDGLLLRRLAARLLVAAGAAGRAEQLWLEGTRAASVEAAWAWVEVARLRERHRNDLRGALDAAAAASRALDLAFALGRGGGIGEIGAARVVVERRLRRLRRWVAARERGAGRGASLPAYSSRVNPGPPRYNPGSAATALPDA